MEALEIFLTLFLGFVIGWLISWGLKAIFRGDDL